MIINNITGCALCNSTWGEFYQTIENKNFFFCCKICALKFKEIVKSIKNYYKIKKIDSLSLFGSSRVRNFVITTDSNRYVGEITFINQNILDFKDLTKDLIE